MRKERVNCEEVEEQKGKREEREKDALEITWPYKKRRTSREKCIREEESLPGRSPVAFEFQGKFHALNYKRGLR